MNSATIQEIPKLTLQEQIDRLADRLEGAKQLENTARENRMAIENQIIELVGSKEEGAFTVKGDRYSLTTTGKLTRTIDEKALPNVLASLPEAIRNRLIKHKPSLDIKEYRYLENNEPELFKVAAQAVITKPAKIAVSFKKLS